jgi:hypothetical protein
MDQKTSHRQRHLGERPAVVTENEVATAGGDGVATVLCDVAMAAH